MLSVILERGAELSKQRSFPSAKQLFSQLEIYFASISVFVAVQLQYQLRYCIVTSDHARV